MIKVSLRKLVESKEAFGEFLQLNIPVKKAYELVEVSQIIVEEGNKYNIVLQSHLKNNKEITKKAEKELIEILDKEIELPIEKITREEVDKLLENQEKIKPITLIQLDWLIDLKLKEN